eukprot:365357-Chlamydomonas_euryale.AAC.15
MHGAVRSVAWATVCMRACMGDGIAVPGGTRAAWRGMPSRGRARRALRCLDVRSFSVRGLRQRLSNRTFAAADAPMRRRTPTAVTWPPPPPPPPSAITRPAPRPMPRIAPLQQGMATTATFGAAPNVATSHERADGREGRRASSPWPDFLLGSITFGRHMSPACRCHCTGSGTGHCREAHGVQEVLRNLLCAFLR